MQKHLIYYLLKQTRFAENENIFMSGIELFSNNNKNHKNGFRRNIIQKLDFPWGKHKLLVNGKLDYIKIFRVKKFPPTTPGQQIYNLPMPTCPAFSSVGVPAPLAGCESAPSVALYSHHNLIDEIEEKKNSVEEKIGLIFSFFWKKINSKTTQVLYQHQEVLTRRS